MTLPALVNVDNMVRDAEAFARNGEIDDLSNLSDDRVYIYHALGDLTVSHSTGLLVEEFYTNFMNRGQILFEDGVASSHGQVKLQLNPKSLE